MATDGGTPPPSLAAARGAEAPTKEQLEVEAKAAEERRKLLASKGGTTLSAADIEGKQININVVQTVPAAADPTPDHDVTVPGGRYWVGGRWVNAWGVPLKQDEGKDEHAEAEDPDKYQVQGQQIDQFNDQMALAMTAKEGKA